MSISPTIWIPSGQIRIGPVAAKNPWSTTATSTFLGAPELESRPFIQSLWRWVEKRCFPHITAGITVNASIAQAYYAEYGQSMEVVRNVPLLPSEGLPFHATGDDQQETRRVTACKELNLPTDRPIWILQGAGINVDRGAEELLEAVGQHPSALLLLVGSDRRETAL